MAFWESQLILQKAYKCFLEPRVGLGIAGKKVPVIIYGVMEIF